METLTSFRTLRERAEDPSILYSNVVRMSRAAERLLNILCDYGMYGQVLQVLGRQVLFIHNLAWIDTRTICMIHFSNVNSAMKVYKKWTVCLYYRCLKISEYQECSKFLWKQLQVVALSVCLLCKAVHSRFITSNDQGLYAISTIFSILSHLHFITIQFGSTGFSVWRDIIDQILITFKRQPSLSTKVLETCFSIGI